MSSFKAPQRNWKSCPKMSDSAGSLTCLALSNKGPPQRREITVASIKITPKERWSTGKWKPNNALPTTRFQTLQKRESRVTGGQIPTSLINQERKQQTFITGSTRVVRPTVRAKMPLLPTSSKPKGNCPCLRSSTIRDEVSRNSLNNYTPSAVPTPRATSLPERLYKGSKLPIPIIQLGRKLPTAPEKARTTAVRTAWVRKDKNEKRSKAKTEFKYFTQRYAGKSGIPLLLKDRPQKPIKETIPCDSPPVPLNVYLLLRQLTLMNQKVSQLRCVLAALQGTVDTVEKSIREEICPCDEISKDLMLSKNGLKSNFESMRRGFKTVSSILFLLKSLNMQALGLSTKEMLAHEERDPMLPSSGQTFLISEDPRKEAVQRSSHATMEDSQIGGKGLDVNSTALDISLSKDEDITVEEIRNGIVDGQIDLLGDPMICPAMTLTDQLLRSEELKSKTIQEVQELVRDRQSSNQKQTIVEAVEEIEENPLKIKAHELVMEVLTEALQEDPTQTISDISPGQIDKMRTEV